MLASARAILIALLQYITAGLRRVRDWLGVAPQQLKTFLQSSFVTALMTLLSVLAAAYSAYQSKVATDITRQTLESERRYRAPYFQLKHAAFTEMTEAERRHNDGVGAPLRPDVPSDPPDSHRASASWKHFRVELQNTGARAASAIRITVDAVNLQQQKAGIITCPSSIGNDIGPSASVVATCPVDVEAQRHFLLRVVYLDQARGQADKLCQVFGWRSEKTVAGYEVRDASQLALLDLMRGRVSPTSPCNVTPPEWLINGGSYSEP